MDLASEIRKTWVNYGMVNLKQKKKATSLEQGRREALQKSKVGCLKKLIFLSKIFIEE